MTDYFEHTIVVGVVIVLIALVIGGGQCTMRTEELRRDYAIECIKAGKQVVQLQCVGS